MKIKVATVFSGIGAFEQALKKLNIDHELVFACDNGERELPYTFDEIHSFIKNKSQSEQKKYIDHLYNKLKKNNLVEESFLANYPINEENFFQDIRFVNFENYRNKLDIYVGGSPCQSFSISGKRLGLEDARGTLFYDYARLIKESKPKVFIYENVPGILSHDKGFTWSKICEIFDDLGYNWKMKALNSRDYGIPQDRKRVFVVGFRNDLNLKKEFSFPRKVILDKSVSDFLESNIDKKYYHGEKGFKWITNEKNLKKRVSINSVICRTQAANQQFNWCGEMRFEEATKELKNKLGTDKHLGVFDQKKGYARKLTPRECLRLMGFSDDFKIVISDQHMYRQCGNSIVVNVLEHLIKSIIETGVFDEK
ncbi:DNA cytosine methyltransferase [Anaerorhabdus sp.]|uniref:DNA cytosine methyltransferase n=1 Tax=Anaerorhabdus sp. TaxID=1872524 RepID=UPI002FC91E28